MYYDFRNTWSFYYIWYSFDFQVFRNERLLNLLLLLLQDFLLLHRSLQRYVNDENSTLNLFKDQEFSKSREVLKAKKRELVEQHAKGNRPARELTEAEEDLLFQTRQFGDHDPETLQRTVWWVLSLHFGFRARDESRKLKWGDVVLGKDPETGGEVLVWTAERGSKTRHGDGQHRRAFNPTAQATNNERCPVRLYKTFARHRPELSNEKNRFTLLLGRKSATKAGL